MTPYWDDNARGIIAGFSDSTKRADIYRALLEGAALELSMLTHRIARESGSDISHYVAIGGGAASDLWCRILADASGLPVNRLSTVEASSLGAGMAAAKGAGWYPSIGEAAKAMSGKPVACFEPDEARRNGGDFSFMRRRNGGDRLTRIKGGTQARVFSWAPRKLMPAWRAVGLVAGNLRILFFLLRS